jgi:HTH-type transcriptional regulator/antitoxin HigA
MTTTAGRRIRPIHSDADYRAAMARLDVLSENNPEPGSPDGDELEVLASLIEQYEDEHEPIALPTLSQALKARADALDLGPQDLDRLFGGSGHRSDVLAGKRALSKTMAGRLRTIGVPDAVLLQQLLVDRGQRRSRQPTGRADSRRYRKTARR